MFKRRNKYRLDSDVKVKLTGDQVREIQDAYKAVAALDAQIGPLIKKRNEALRSVNELIDRHRRNSHNNEEAER